MLRVAARHVLPDLGPGPGPEPGKVGRHLDRHRVEPALVARNLFSDDGCDVARLGVNRELVGLESSEQGDVADES